MTERQENRLALVRRVLAVLALAERPAETVDIARAVKLDPRNHKDRSRIWSVMTGLRLTGKVIRSSSKRLVEHAHTGKLRNCPITLWTLSPEALKEEALVTAPEARKKFGIRPGTISHWLKRKRITVAGQRKNGRGKSNLYRVGDLLAEKAGNCNPIAIKTPKGYVTISTAEGMLRMSRTRIAELGKRGLLKITTRNFSPAHARLYVNLKSIKEYKVRRLAPPEPEVVTLSTETILSPDNEICLAARRILWERNNRRMNLEKVLAAGKQAG